MARVARENLLCTVCDWRGVTTRGRARLGVYRVSTALVGLLVALELTGVTALGPDLWTAALIIMFGSIALRLLIRGDRCQACGGRAIYVKRLPPRSAARALGGGGAPQPADDHREAQ